MVGLLRFVFAMLVWPFTSKARLHAEIVARQQVIVLQPPSSVPRRWFDGIELGFIATGGGRLAIAEGARRSTRLYVHSFVR
jgi:hypothetical protein